MDFISTRGGKAVSSKQAILKGIADDGGLYVPSSFPNITLSELESLIHMDYPQRAFTIISKFLTDYDNGRLLEFCKTAYSKFEGKAAPVIKVEDDTYVLELWHGPTLAFKDMALTLLPYLLTEAKLDSPDDTQTLILVATSGDTGKAALEGFSNVEGTRIIVLYPSDGVSDMQKLQMKTTLGNNVSVIGIEGNFDDAQQAVKAIFNDKDTVKKIKELGYSLSSANSINFGRLVPQIAYYFSAYADLVAFNQIELGDKINFSVPTGNFGNILAGYYAKKMGLPINKLIVASNSNNVLTDFFDTGSYDINRKFIKTISPSMDILISSNLERLLFEIFDRDSLRVNMLMDELKIYGNYTLDEIDIERLSEDFKAYWSDEEESLQAIDNFYTTYGYLIDPHTAVAAASLNTYIMDTEDESKAVILSTASPYKFCQDVYSAISNKHENDAFIAAKKLENFTKLMMPRQIKELKELEILHDIVIPKTEIRDTILEILNKE